MVAAGSGVATGLGSVALRANRVFSVFATAFDDRTGRSALKVKLCCCGAKNSLEPSPTVLGVALPCILERFCRRL